MRTFIARDPSAVTFIQEHLLPDDDYQEGKLVEMLKSMLTYAKDNIFLPIVIDGEKPVGFLVAIAPPDQNHTWIVQAWADPELSDVRVKDLIFIELVMWTLSLGRRFVRGETKRKTGPFLRRWGFRAFSQILDYEISKNFEERILAKSKKLEMDTEQVFETGEGPVARKSAEQIRSEAKARRAKKIQESKALAKEDTKNGHNEQTGGGSSLIPLAESTNDLGSSEEVDRRGVGERALRRRANSGDAAGTGRDSGLAD